MKDFRTPCEVRRKTANTKFGDELRIRTITGYRFRQPPRRACSSACGGLGTFALLRYFPAYVSNRPTRRHRETYRTNAFTFSDDGSSGVPDTDGFAFVIAVFSRRVFLRAGPEGQPFSLITSLTASFHRRPCSFPNPYSTGFLSPFSIPPVGESHERPSTRVCRLTPKSFDFTHFQRCLTAFSRRRE